LHQGAAASVVAGGNPAAQLGAFGGDQATPDAVLAEIPVL
jgi:hypothetical protein